MLKSSLSLVALTLLLLFGISSDNSATQSKPQSSDGRSETIEKLIAASGSAEIDIDLDRFADEISADQKSNLATVHFGLAPDSFFTIVVNNNDLRTLLPGSMALIPP